MGLLYRLSKCGLQIVLILNIGLLLALPVFAQSDQPELFSPHASSSHIYLPLISNIPEPSIPLPGENRVFYLSPNGHDSNSGTYEEDAWATFDRAWQDLHPGDTLILLDGVYYQSLNPNIRNGEPGNPITIRAKNDGQVVIDGQYQRVPVKLGEPKGEYFIIEGIVARNSIRHVYWIVGDNNILKRVSGYNANVDENAHVFVIASSSYNLIEDCIAVGTGRKMIVMFQANNNTVRRCFAEWQQWDGRNWGSCWPWGDGIEIYNASYDTIENSISYTRNPTWSISLMAQGDGDEVYVGNKILGSMAILAGMKEDLTPMEWGDTRPQPTNFTCVRDFLRWPGQRAGFDIYEAGAVARDNLLQDIFAWGSAGVGLSWFTSVDQPASRNNHVNHATIINNGLDNPHVGGGLHTDALQNELAKFNSVENSRIDNIFIDFNPDGSRNMTSMTGEGARLTHRYVDGVLTNEPLWPWPMEDRIQAELGISVTDMMTELIFGTSNLAEIYR